jgi:hypothetical protein
MLMTVFWVVVAVALWIVVFIAAVMALFTLLARFGSLVGSLMFWVPFTAIVICGIIALFAVLWPAPLPIVLLYIAIIGIAGLVGSGVAGVGGLLMRLGKEVHDGHSTPSRDGNGRAFNATTRSDSGPPSLAF